MAGAALPDLQVTRGAAQTQPDGGTCMVSTGFIGRVPEPCPDAYVSKVRVSGNTSSTVFATYLGGDTADQATALAVDAAGNIYVTGTTGGDFPVTPKAQYGAVLPEAFLRRS